MTNSALKPETAHDPLEAALDKERALNVKIADRSAELDTARALSERLEAEYLRCAASASGPQDQLLIELRAKQQQAKELVDFLEAAIAGERQELRKTQGERYELARAQHLKTTSRLTNLRTKAAERLQAAIEEYVISSLEFYEVSGRLVTSDATPGHELSKPGWLLTRVEMGQLIEDEISRLNPVLAIDAKKKAVVPGQHPKLAGNPSKAPRLADRVKANNARLLSTVAEAPASLKLGA